jgi:hypothetical protein
MLKRKDTTPQRAYRAWSRQAVAAEEREVDFVLCEKARSAVSSVGKPGMVAPTVNAPKRDMRMPTSIKQAINCPLYGPQWLEAIANEWAGLQDKNCYKTVKLEKFMKSLLSFKAVFKVKFHADGTLNKFKVRLVVGGHKAIKGQHFDEKFSPVLSIVVLRLIKAIFAAYPHVVTTVADVEQAYLNSVLNEKVYVRAPPGLRVEKLVESCDLTDGNGAALHAHAVRV